MIAVRSHSYPNNEPNALILGHYYSCAIIMFKSDLQIFEKLSLGKFEILDPARATKSRWIIVRKEGCRSGLGYFGSLQFHRIETSETASPWNAIGTHSCSKRM